MKRAIEILNAPTSGYVPFTLEVKEPGMLRTILTGWEPPSTIIPASMGTPPQAEMKPIPAFVFEVDPDGASRERTFVWVPAGKALDFAGVLLFQATYVDETSGMPLMLYEAIKG